MRPNRANCRNSWSALRAGRRGCSTRYGAGVAVYRGRETDLYFYASRMTDAAVSSALKNWTYFIRSRKNADCRGCQGTSLQARGQADERQLRSDGCGLRAGECQRRRAPGDAMPLAAAKESGRQGEKSFSAWAGKPRRRCRLENFRRFSATREIEAAKWVEDIDAISDYIVVHDRAWKILAHEPFAGIASGRSTGGVGGR